jgi:hypothetical protein
VYLFVTRVFSRALTSHLRITNQLIVAPFKGAHPYGFVESS